MPEHAAAVRHPRVIALLFAAGLSSAAEECAAQTIDDHLREGFALRQRGAEAEALARFEAAWALAQTPRVAAQLGLTHQALGHWIDAERFLRLAVADADDPWVHRNRASLDAALRIVGQHLGELELVGSPPGASVSVDGRVAGTLPLAEPLHLLAGIVDVEVSAEGHVPARRRVVVDPGASLREEVTLVRVPPPPPAPPPPPPPPPPPTAATAPPARHAPLTAPGASPTHVLGVAMASAGGALVAFGIVSVALREATAQDYNARCPSPRPGLSTDCLSLLDAESRWSTAGWVGLAAGGALLIGGVSAIVVDWRGRRRAAWSCLPGWGVVTCAARF